MPFTRLVKRYEPRLRATPRKRVVYEPRALSSVRRITTDMDKIRTKSEVRIKMPYLDEIFDYALTSKHAILLIYLQNTCISNAAGYKFLQLVL